MGPVSPHPGTEREGSQDIDLIDHSALMTLTEGSSGGYSSNSVDLFADRLSMVASFH